MDAHRVIEVTEVDPAGRFHPSLIWTAVPFDVTPNSTIIDGSWSIARYDRTDHDRAQTLQNNIAGLRDDPGAADRIAAYEQELIEVQARIEQARLDAEAKAALEVQGNDTVQGDA